jgi:hypothetical protein
MEERECVCCTFHNIRYNKQKSDVTSKKVMVTTKRPLRKTNLTDFDHVGQKHSVKRQIIDWSSGAL